MRSDAIDDVRARLVGMGADALSHVSGTLDQHVQRTEKLLRQWGSRHALCVAGLYHAVYGTAGIEGALVTLDQRDRITDIIGAESERIAYLYGACARATFHPRIGTRDQLLFVDRFKNSEYGITHAELCDFCELTIANELELAISTPAFRHKHRDALSALFERMRGTASTAAIASYERTLGVAG